MISVEQARDGGGELLERAKASGLDIAEDSRSLPRISYDSLVYAMGDSLDYIVAKKNGIFALRGSSVKPSDSIAGARGYATIQDSNNRTISMPFVALQKTPNEAQKIAMLATPHDITDPANEKTTSALNLLQHNLLDSALAQSLNGVGSVESHGKNGQINAGDIGHGALIATIDYIPDVSLHALTHNLGDDRATASTVMKQTSIYNHNGDERKTDIAIRSIDEVLAVQFAAVQQLEEPSAMNAFEVGVGLARAAVNTRTIARATDTSNAPAVVDMAANIEAMAA